jgi:hypothetical protein
VNYTSLALCTGIDGSCQGTVYTQFPVAWSCLGLNFSDCRPSGDFTSSDGRGAAFYTGLSESSLAFSHSSVLRCIGLSGIDRSATQTLPAGSVLSSNFYNNSMSDSYGVIYCEGRGMTISLCIFQGNTKEIALGGDSSTKFDVLNCVCSGSLPAGAYYGSTSGNSFNLITLSLALIHLFSVPCDAPLASNSPRPSSTIFCSRSSTPDFTFGRSYLIGKHTLFSASFYLVMLLRPVRFSSS